MTDKERLEFLIKYHENLCEQLKAHDVFNYNDLNKTVNELKAMEVEQEIESLLLPEKENQND